MVTDTQTNTATHPQTDRTDYNTLRRSLRAVAAVQLTFLVTVCKKISLLKLRHSEVIVMTRRAYYAVTLEVFISHAHVAFFVTTLV